MKNKFAVGDTVEIINSTGNQTVKVESIVDLKGKPLDAALGGGYQVRIPLPAAANGYDKHLLPSTSRFIFIQTFQHLAKMPFIYH